MICTHCSFIDKSKAPERKKNFLSGGQRVINACYYTGKIFIMASALLIFFSIQRRWLDIKKSIYIYMTLERSIVHLMSVSNRLSLLLIHLLFMLYHDTNACSTHDLY